MKRPLALTITGWFFIFAGLGGFAYHFYEHLNSGFDTEAILVLIVRVAAIIGGVLVLKAYDIGRWLLLAWMAYHVVLSFYHDVMHDITFGKRQVLRTKRANRCRNVLFHRSRCDVAPPPFPFAQCKCSDKTLS